ncbi:molybdenum cofactor biosynthesis protein MoaE [Helicobacter ailurogastricus]|uniref:Molybdopterin synthase catalytic subunit n=1 Tax=Helicobacter ailurogastricus TaxID=1578720 RepID=A0A0K2X6D7_9HELI|nr:molybdenum cofactor biosynthesis protein MoaE [Helicobacter ailurogastricus]CRF41148.1 Molybdenum cofactor biosynthesis protein MoaE [Helicobacter ailurogastricus]CRF42232.1 Molybdenum cofactor biosynthesis protein MoaE [Helicobacter ailurogastricus]CRF43580.1 Molybdenum cofactor biosynthesis protein MoaE [Helicobacter ailurogastricus]CRF52363.1 Molybdenum cofactor biosynthesis protein MoaE [Helicobacter ailurogastricus]BDQ29487.1 molybdopterin synthase catalytic subunit [Helicobacter ailur
MLEIVEGALDTGVIYSAWARLCVEKNLGALCVFSGFVRPEEGLEGLSFEVYMPLFEAWFHAWQQRAGAGGVFLCLAHSMGDVLVGQSSYMAGLMGAHRKKALELYNPFIEDFKRNAPIYKYDLKNGQRIYAKDRSHPLKGSGLLQ